MRVTSCPPLPPRPLLSRSRHPPPPPGASRRSREPRLCHPVGPCRPRYRGRRPSTPLLRARPPALPRPRPLRFRRFPPVIRECGRSCRPPPGPPRPLYRHSGAGAGPSPAAAAAALQFPAAPGSAVPSAPGAAARRPQRPLCALPREALPPPEPAVQARAARPELPTGPAAAQTPTLAPPLPAFGRDPPVPARHRLRWDRGAPATPCRRRAAPAQRPLSAAPARRASGDPGSQRLHAAVQPPTNPPQQNPAASTLLLPPPRDHLPPPAAPGSSPADEAAPPPPVVAFSLLPPPLHGGPSRAFPPAAPRFTAARLLRPRPSRRSPPRPRPQPRLPWPQPRLPLPQPRLPLPQLRHRHPPTLRQPPAPAISLRAASSNHSAASGISRTHAQFYLHGPAATPHCSGRS
ncbi:basic proline-rich protein-like [Agelaius tricolor]|uniref:basic proline-rich protein-like n=1 Tax=Agelaius tricolor TaxID=9191 RepID=UPI0039F24F07